MRKVSPFMAMAVGLLPIVAGCGAGPASSSAASKETVTVWDTYTGPQQAAFTHLVKQFNASQSRVVVKPQFIVTGDLFLPKLLTAISDHTNPPLVAGGYPTWGAELLKTHQVVPLASWMKNSHDPIPMSQFIPGVLKVSSYRGTLLSLPTDGGDYGIFYNKNDFQAAHITQPPATWSQVAADAQKLTRTAQGRYGIYIPFGTTEWTVWTWEGLLWAAGGHFLNRTETQAAFDSSQGVRALSIWDHLIQSHVAYPTSLATPQSPIGQEGFSANRVAMLIDGPWDVKTFTGKVSFGTAMFPAVTTRATNLGTDVVYLFKTPTRTDQAAWTFLHWWMQPQTLAKWDISSGYLPTTVPAAKTSLYRTFLAKHPLYKPFVQNLQYAHGRPSLKSYPAISHKLGVQLDRSFHGQISPQAALSTASHEANAILAANHE